MANGSITIDVLLDSLQAQNGLNRLSNQAGKLSPAFGAVTVAVTALTTAIAGVGAVAVAQFLEAEQASVKLQNQLGIGAERAQDLTNVARDIYNKGFGESLGEVTEALSKVRQNIGFLNNEDLQEVTNQALGLAQTFDADLNEVTRAGANIAKAYGIEAQEAFDLLAYGAQNGLNFSGELFDNISEYIPLFQQYGYSAEEAFGFLINGSQQGVYNLDYINDIVKEFGIRAQDASTTTADAFARLGGNAQLAFEQFQNGEISVQQLSETTGQALAGIDDALLQNSIGVDLFGTKFEDLGADVAISLFTGSTAVSNFAGSANTILDNLANTTQARFDSIVRTVTGFLVPIGAQIVTAIDNALQGVISTFNTYQEQIFTTATAVWTQIEPFITNVLTTVSNFVSFILTEIVTFWESNGERIINIVTTAFNIISSVVETVLPIVLGVVKFVWGAIVDVIEGAIGIIDGAIKLFSAVINGDFTALWEAVKQIFSSAVQFIVGLLTLSFVGSIRTLLTNFATASIATIRSLWTNITTSFTNSASAVTGTVANLVNGVRTFFSNLASGVINTVSTFATNVTTSFGNIATNILNAFRNLPSQFIQFGKDIINGLINGIRSIDVLAVVGDIASGMVDRVKGALQIFSPSRVFKGIGEDINAGWTIGLEDSAGDVLNAVTGTTDSLLAEALNASGNLLGGFNGLNVNTAGLTSGTLGTTGLSASNTTNNTPTQVNNITVRSSREEIEIARQLRKQTFAF